MVVAEEELACRKLPAITHHVEKQGVKFGSDDKITRKTCTEMVDIIADLLLQTLHDISAKGKYVSLTGDGSETWKTGEEKELVLWQGFVKRLSNFSPWDIFSCLPVVKSTWQTHWWWNKSGNASCQLKYV